jgi:hypothetical protein
MGIVFEDSFIPVGTAFTCGRIQFVLSAAHNVREAVKREDRLSHLLLERQWPKAIDLKAVGISVIHQREIGDGRLEIAVWPVETFDGGVPLDIVFGHLNFQVGRPTINHKVSFGLPAINEKVWSLGYSDFEYPDGGIPLSEVREGSFDWPNKYRHRLRVVEGRVERIFLQAFARGFLEGPCFTFGADIRHGQSGGPVLSTDGVVRGINSAGVGHFFDRPATASALLYPLLASEIRFGATMGPLSIRAIRRIIDLIDQDAILTDGSEEQLGLRQDHNSGELLVSPSASAEMGPFIHDDFANFQQGGTATRVTGEFFRLRRAKVPNGGDQ